MGRSHRYFLSLGSNIDPEANLAHAIEQLRAHGEIEAVSGVWESRAVGASGPNFLNLCLSIIAPLETDEFKIKVARDIETRMGRVRDGDRSAPRAIDIDILMADGTPLNIERWSHPFVIMPLAELLPDFVHPTRHRPLSALVKETRAETWIVPRAKRPPAT